MTEWKTISLTHHWRKVGVMGSSVRITFPSEPGYAELKVSIEGFVFLRWVSK